MDPFPSVNPSGKDAADAAVRCVYSFSLKIKDKFVFQSWRHYQLVMGHIRFLVDLCNYESVYLCCWLFTRKSIESDQPLQNTMVIVRPASQAKQPFARTQHVTLEKKT